MYVKYSIRIEFVIHSRDVSTVGAPAFGQITQPAADQSEGGDNWANLNRNTLDLNGEEGTYQHEPGQVVQGGIDHQLAYLRRILTQPGRRLTIAGIGLGPDLDVNNPAENAVDKDVAFNTSLYDVAWGPKPRSVTWEPIGSSSAARIVWECEVGLVECENVNLAYKERKLSLWGVPGDPLNPTDGALPTEVLQVVYNESWDLDVNGMTTKTYDAIIKVRGYIDSAELIAAFQGIGSRESKGESADAYRIYFEPALQVGYLRKRRYRINDDKTELSITITDTEVESDWPYPPGVSDISCNYSLGSSLAGGGGGLFKGATGFQMWTCSLAGSITMTKGWHPYWRRIYPYYIFLLLIRSRYRPALGKREDDEKVEDSPAGAESDDAVGFGGGGDDAADLKAKGQRRMQIPTDFSISEEIFGRSFSFDFRWMSLVGKPEEAPRYLRFGYPPNIFAEDQARAKPDDFLTAQKTVAWDWDMWTASVIGNVRGASPPDPGWLAWGNGGRGGRFTTSVPGSLKKKTFIRKPAIILDAWGIKAPPMSIYGADNLRFEHDNRMEPCLNNQDFWYQRAKVAGPKNADDLAMAGMPAFHDMSNDSSMKIISMSTDTELTEEQQTIAVSPLNTVEDPATLMKYVDGRSNEGTWGNTAVESGLQNQYAVAVPKVNHLGDTDMSYDMVEWKYGITDAVAPKAQALGAPKYGLRVFGQAITVGKPLNAPRVEEYGLAKAVKTGNSRTTVNKLTHGAVELWLTRWDLNYILLGTPNGIPPAESTYPVDMIGSTQQPSQIYTEGQTAIGDTRRFG
tara:strand:+ start:5285 stop:7675 length:2391 start_codon:yes stop_codon:yes gene_type:complete